MSKRMLCVCPVCGELANVNYCVPVRYGARGSVLVHKVQCQDEALANGARAEPRPNAGVLTPTDTSPLRPKPKRLVQRTTSQLSLALSSYNSERTCTTPPPSPMSFQSTGAELMSSIEGDLNPSQRIQFYISVDAPFATTPDYM